MRSLIERESGSLRRHLDLSQLDEDLGIISEMVNIALVVLIRYPGISLTCKFKLKISSIVLAVAIGVSRKFC